ncbi:MAG: hypothetical protein U1B80_02000 [Anaerolineaceae bacterium]|nr:hypothetical protein [Anaerolineaceae bacterium]
MRQRRIHPHRVRGGHPHRVRGGHPHLLLWVLVVLALLSSATAFAAANIVPASGLSDRSRAITLNDLKPPQCAGITVVNRIVGSGVINGTNENDLILASPGIDTLFGSNRNDCLVGGGGNDTLNGGNHDDVLIGGPGTDICDGGNGTDICDNTCETRISCESF